jgi:hypothetical protein
MAKTIKCCQISQEDTYRKIWTKWISKITLNAWSKMMKNSSKQVACLNHMDGSNSIG